MRSKMIGNPDSRISGQVPSITSSRYVLYGPLASFMIRARDQPASIQCMMDAGMYDSRGPDPIQRSSGSSPSSSVAWYRRLPDITASRRSYGGQYPAPMSV